MKFFYILIILIALVGSYSTIAAEKDKQTISAISENLKHTNKQRDPVSDERFDMQSSKEVSRNLNKNVECEKKCGEAPRLIDLPNPNASEYVPFLDKLTMYIKCTNKCYASKSNKQNSKTQDSTVESLKNELNTCKAQLQLVQEKEPAVYNKLIRDMKKIREYGGHSPGYFKGGEDTDFDKMNNPATPK